MSTSIINNNQEFVNQDIKTLYFPILMCLIFFWNIQVFAGKKVAGADPNNPEIFKNEHNLTSDTISKNASRDKKQKGFTNITEFDFGFGKVTSELGKENQISFGLQTINGYQFSRNFSLGVGTGIVKYHGFMIPVFADFRINFLKSTVTPFVSLAAGYSFSLSEDNYGGVLLAPALGIKFFVSPKTALNFSVGYRYQTNSFDSSWKNNHFTTTTTRYKEILNFLTLKLGVVF